MAITNQEQFNEYMTRRMAYFAGRTQSTVATVHHGVLANGNIRLLFSLQFRYPSRVSSGTYRFDGDITCDIGIPRAPAERKAVIAKCLLWAQTWCEQELQA